MNIINSTSSTQSHEESQGYSTTQSQSLFPPRGPTSTNRDLEHVGANANGTSTERTQCSGNQVLLGALHSKTNYRISDPDEIWRKHSSAESGWLENATGSIAGGKRRSRNEFDLSFTPPFWNQRTR